MGGGSPKELRGMNFKMMPVGDSITCGGPPDLTNSYRGHLLDLLEPSNTIDMVGPGKWGTMKPPERNRLDAFMGRRIEHCHTSLKTSIPEWKPDVILLHAGTNDIVPDDEASIGAPERLDDLLETVYRLSPETATIVAGIMPAAFREDQIKGFNAAVEEKVKRRRDAGQKFFFVDFRPNWPKDAHHDMVHPNDKGFRYMADLWKGGLESMNGLGWIA